jgi:hypothetical protein
MEIIAVGFRRMIFVEHVRSFREIKIAHKIFA